MTFHDLERPLRILFQNTCFRNPLYENLSEDRVEEPYYHGKGLSDSTSSEA